MNSSISLHCNSESTVPSLLYQLGKDTVRYLGVLIHGSIFVLYEATVNKTRITTYVFAHEINLGAIRIQLVECLEFVSEIQGDDQNEMLFGNSLLILF